jgi:ATP phosphoribosyltransferase regulatory subunit
MDESLHPALLPAGLSDLLPPDAQIEADAIQHLTATLASHGYRRVKPPLVEFEESLLGGPGAAMAHETFRMMDPISQRMIGVRADITLQIGRIATTRLLRAPRPLRLSYAGQVLRVKGSQLRPERQIGQVGAEIIGSDAATADAEIIALAAEALAMLGVAGLSADLTLPALAPGLLRHLGASPALAQAARQALDSKDAAAVASLGGEAARLLGLLMAAAGPADTALTALAAIALPEAARTEIERLRQVVDLVRRMAPDLSITIDPVENRGFEYHTGVSFTFFARGFSAELGRGGRYLAQPGGSSGEVALAAIEPATGFTLYTESVLAAAPPPPASGSLYVPFGTPLAVAKALRQEGWATIMGLAAAADPKLEAERLGCDHYHDGEGVFPA